MSSIDFEVFEDEELPPEAVELMDVGDLDGEEEEVLPIETPQANGEAAAVEPPTTDEVMVLLQDSILLSKIRTTQQVATFLRHVVTDIRVVLKKEPTIETLTTIIEKLEPVQPPITAVTLALQAHKTDLRDRMLRVLGTPHVPTPRQKKVLATDDSEGEECDEYEEGEFEDIDFELLGIDPARPTTAKPGTEEKVLVLAARYASGVPLWHEEDCMDQNADGGFSYFKRERAS